MNKRYKAVISAIVGATVLAGVILPVALPTHTALAAKWFNRTSNQQVNNDEEAVTAYAAVKKEAAVEGETTAEVVFSTNDGETRVIIEQDTESPVSVAVDKVTVEALQRAVEQGDRTWLLDPVKVVQNYAGNYGFDAQNDIFTLISQVYKDNRSQTGEASVLVKHGDKYYLVQLIQPAGYGTDKVWQVASIKNVKVITKSAGKNNSKVDVGPGVEGLDYDKVVKWQQNVDAGYEQWRLDPLKVAKIEGRNYGFTDNDTYTIIRKLNSSTIARHGQVDVEVSHNGKIYTMIIVRPFGGSDAIWTTYKVIGQKPSVPAPGGKVLFETSKFKDWKWQKGQYPSDMAFATIVDYDAQLARDKRIPEIALQKVKDVDYNNKVALFAYLGATSGGYGIGIEKVTMQGVNITVQVRTKSPKPGDMATMMLTYPSDYVLIDRSLVDIWGGVNVTFVDQDGKVLSKNKLTIEHRR